ncbi:DNA replication/repair protein RecF [Fulvivirgaceae bacterium BMA10]|uniref:DNA replication and repair protein RecF n=1 Tax=Splendidivirga corallicola TaxID=3051826 RepID=A0ABT8KUJ5_9BACT|nr:DNA replication/repair protein RecF [Fulvivirgaceae bacterium BMA10]
MRLENLSLTNFKNYEILEIDFQREVNCIVGINGSGKTNLLDAIHYLSLTKSAFNSIDSQNIKHENDFFSVRGRFVLHEKVYSLQCSLKNRQKKIFKVDGKPYEKISEHVGRFPVVLINPNDTDLIREGSEIRRRFVDSIVSQMDHNYLLDLIKYNHVLKQRNSLLKKFSETNTFDKDLIEPFDLQLLSVGRRIFEKRQSFLTSFKPLFKTHYDNLSEKREETSIKYHSDLLSTNFKEDFLNNIKKDLALQRTTAGIHKDDFLFEINNFPLKKFGSQGQQKSFVIALKLAQFDLIKEKKGFVPILLLDDIFDKLDDLRINKLMEMLINESFGQVFITDARPERTQRIFESLDIPMQIFHVENGGIIGK